jgi:hypothetical protein
MLKRLRKTSDDTQATNWVPVPDIQFSVPSNVPNSRLPTAVSSNLPSVATSTVSIASPTRCLVAALDVGPSWQQALSTAFDEPDAKPVYRPAAQLVRSFSDQLIDPWSVLLEYPRTEDFLLQPSPEARLETSEQVYEVLRTENEALTTENLVLRGDFNTLKRKMRVLAQVRVPAEAFGAEAWGQYFGEVAEEPLLPLDIDEILHGPCPLWTGKAVKDTHLLVLIPAAVDGKPLSLNLLGELIKSPKGGGYPTKYSFYGSETKAAFGDQSPRSSYWVLMTRDVLEGSRDRCYTDQKKLLAQHASRTNFPYELPSALEAAAVILSHYVRSGERLYTDGPWTWTRCQELLGYGDGSHCPVVVGGFSARGFHVGRNFLDDSSCGVASLQRL